MSALLLDTHVVHWWSAEPDRISRPARRVLKAADELLIAAVSWYELAWLAERQRIVLDIPIRAWLGDLSAQVRTLGLTPGIADSAATPCPFETPRPATGYQRSTLLPPSTGRQRRRAGRVREPAASNRAGVTGRGQPSVPSKVAGAGPPSSPRNP